VAKTLKSPGQPFKFGGVARYASARFGGFLAMAALFAFVSAAVMGRFVAHCWWPVITEAVGALPNTGKFQSGFLQVPENEMRLLAANQFLSLQLAPSGFSQEVLPADAAVQFGKYELMVTSIFGDTVVSYPDGWNVALDRAVLWPIWGAWKVPLLAAFMAGVMVLLVLAWFVLGVIYAPLVLLVGWLARREVTFGGAWKLGVAAQWPASLLMAFALALYSTGDIALLFVIIMFAVHFLPSLLNVLVAPFFLPKPSLEEKENPFATEKRQKRARRNPFQAANAEED